LWIISFGKGRDAAKLGIGLRSSTFFPTWDSCPEEMAKDFAVLDEIKPIAAKLTLLQAALISFCFRLTIGL